VNLNPSDLDPRAQKILETCEPYVITYPGNLSALDLAPFGWQIKPENQFDPTTLRSRGAIDALHRLDSFTFGDQDMLMPRWVLFDCGEFPGIVFGVGRKAKDIEAGIRKAYQVEGAQFDEEFVPLSMWVAIPCAESGAWFGHNLSSSNVVATSETLPGLATFTKAYGVKLTKATKQYGATQWDSTSLNIHMSLGRMHLLCAYTPAHTHPETFAYRIDVDDDSLTAPLRPGFKMAVEGGSRCIDNTDPEAVKTLHNEIEAGEKLSVYRVERGEGPQKVWLIPAA
jgi:hypothetical protein